MSSIHDEKVVSHLQRLAAEFLVRNASIRSLITVTDVRLSYNGTRATIFISVLPEGEAEYALAFAKRKRSELKHYVQEHIRMKRIPLLDFALDKKRDVEP